MNFLGRHTLIGGLVGMADEAKRGAVRFEGGISDDIGQAQRNVEKANVNCARQRHGPHNKSQQPETQDEREQEKKRPCVEFRQTNLPDN